MKCRFCPREVEPARARAGLPHCMACGDAAAKLDIASKQSMVAPAYNKGASMLVGTSDPKQAALDAGRKTSATPTDFVPVVGRRASTTKSKPKRLRVGLMWDARGDCYTLYAGEDPQKRGAVRFLITEGS